MQSIVLYQKMFKLAQLNLTSKIRRISTLTPKMLKKALVFLAPGAEEMEFVISVDVLRRAGVDVTVAGLPDRNAVKCSRGVVIIPDIGVEEALTNTYDALVLPGGLGGSKAMAESPVVGQLLKEQEKRGKFIAAICAAPTSLKAHRICYGKNITSYPTVESTLMEGSPYVYKDDNVVIDGNLITSRGPGTAYKFALAIVEALLDKEKAEEVAKGLLLTA